MFNIVMPFSRHHLINELLDWYNHPNVMLHLVVFQDQFKNLISDKIKIWIVKPCGKGIDICYYKCNQFKTIAPIIDDDYYLFTTDDNALEKNVISEVLKMNDEVVYISMKRGHNIVPNPSLPFYQSTNTLVAAPENAKRASIAFGQLIFKGHAYKKVQYDDTKHYADGLMGAYVKENLKVRYEPNLYALYNWFEPGRWNK
jgi:hypothetical protein